MSIQNHINGLQHIGVPTNDLEATIQFFQTLGFAVALRVASDTEPVAFLSQKNIMIETYENKQAAETPGAIDHVAIDVDDIQAVYQAVSAMGYTVLEDGIQTLPFWERGVQFFTISGPNAEKVEFSQRL